MSTAVAEPVCSQSPTEYARKRWTRAEVQILDTSGILAGQHLELISGELLNKMGKNRPNVNATTGLRLWMERVFGADSWRAKLPSKSPPLIKA